MQTIQECLELMTFYEVQVFLGFMNFYYRFIVEYLRIAGLLTTMLQGSKDSKKIRLYDMTPEARIAFCRLKVAFMAVPIL